MRTLATTAGLLAVAAMVFATGYVTTYYVDFPKGHEGRTFTRTIKGNDKADYLVRKVEDQQKLDITIRSSNEATYFDVYDPNATSPRFTGWKEGEQFTGRFDAGTVKVRVYQRYDVAARKESANYTLTITPGDVPPR